MGFRFVQNYPAWFTLLCLLAGLIFTALLYYRNRSAGFSSRVQIGLSVLRFLSVSLLAFLLLSPLIQRNSRYVEEPLILFLQDNSSSLVLGKDSLYYREAYIHEKQSMLSHLKRRFNVRHFNFGEFLRESEETGYDDRMTNISSAFQGVVDLFSNRNVGAVILASDGIYNRGNNPVFYSEQTPFPIYTLALGDTLPQRDLILKKITHNRLTYLGNRFPVEVEIEARELRGKTTRLTISRGEEVLFVKMVSFNSNFQLESIIVELEAEAPGLQKYTALLSPVEDEMSLANNTQDFFIEVIDSRQKVLILANNPHPDVGAIRMSLEESDNYEVSAYLAENFDGTPEAYNLVIFHQLPSPENPMRDFLQRQENQKIPALFVIGSQTHIPLFNQLKTGLTLNPRSTEFTEALAALNARFPLFLINGEPDNWLNQLPPLYVPFATYHTGSGANTLLFQKIGTVETKQPMIMFSETGSRKIGVISGEGIWRWRMQTFLQTKSHRIFDEFIWQAVQYLSLKEDKSFFRVNHDHYFNETDPVIFETELYNPSYELINEPAVQLTILNEEGVEFHYEMGKTSQAYRLNIGAFPPGEYSYRAKTSHGNQTYFLEGNFSVSALNIEQLRHIADHSLLFQIAENSGGTLFFPGQWKELEEAILSRDDILPMMYSQKEFFELVNLKAVFIILLFFLTAEWFTRKWNGGF